VLCEELHEVLLMNFTWYPKESSARCFKGSPQGAPFGAPHGALYFHVSTLKKSTKHASLQRQHVTKAPKKFYEMSHLALKIQDMFHLVG
jgi:hypothetical protein